MPSYIDQFCFTEEDCARNLTSRGFYGFHPEEFYGPDYVSVPILSGLVFLLSTAIFFVLLIFIIVRRNIQPVKSRNFISMIITLSSSNFIISLTSFRFTIGRFIFPCFVYVYSMFFLFPFLFLPTCLRAWRLLFILKLSQLKVEYRGNFAVDRNSTILANLIKPETHNKNLKRKLWTFSISNTYAAIVFIIAFIVHNIIAFVLLYITQFPSYFKFYQGCGIHFNFVIAILAQAGAYILTLIILGIALLRVKDAYNIKRELYISLIMWITGAVSFYVAASIPYVNIVTDRYVPYGVIFWIVAWADQVVCIVIPIIETYRNHHGNIANTKSELDAVLSDDTLRKKFLKYCEQSFAPENVLCWEDIEQFKKVKPKRRKKSSIMLIDTYLKPGAMNELNLENTPQIVKEIENQINEDKLDTTTFDKLQKLVVANMSDTFNRFRTTTEYKKYMEEKEAKEKLLKQQFDQPTVKEHNPNQRKSTVVEF